MYIENGYPKFINSDDGMGRKVMRNTNTMRTLAVCDFARCLRYEGYSKEEAYGAVTKFNTEFNFPPLDAAEIKFQFNAIFTNSKLSFTGIDRNKQILERYIKYKDEGLDSCTISEKLNRFNATCNLPPLLDEEIERIKAIRAYASTTYESYIGSPTITRQENPGTAKTQQPQKVVIKDCYTDHTPK